MSELLHVALKSSHAQGIHVAFPVFPLPQGVESLALHLREDLDLLILVQEDLIEDADLVVGDEPAEEGEAVLDGLFEVSYLVAVVGLVVDALDEDDVENILH